MASLDNKIVFITGGAIALCVAREDAKIAVADIDAQSANRRAAEIAASGRDAIPMGRAAMPKEIALTALFLVKDENNYIIGQTLHVNGAWLNY